MPPRKIVGEEIEEDAPGRSAVRGPGKTIEVELPDSVPDHVGIDAENGSDMVRFREMSVSDGYDETHTIRYAWDLDELSPRERQDVTETIKRVHDNYDDLHSGETDSKFVVRLDYHP